MTLFAHIQIALDALAQHRDLPPLHLDPQGFAGFDLAPGQRAGLLLVDAEEAAPKLRLVAELGCIEGPYFKPLAEAMLALNGSPTQTLGASFGLNPDTQQVLALVPITVVQLAPDLFLPTCSQFFECAQDWQQRLQSGDTQLGQEKRLRQTLDRLSSRLSPAKRKKLLAGAGYPG